MKDCESIFAALSSYLDGELLEAKCDELERHIHDCAPCVEFVNSLQKSIRLGRQYNPREALPPIPSELKQKLERIYREMLARVKKEN
jgi:anti-sigma factor RsiW